MGSTDNNTSTTFMLTLTALFAAVLAVASWISVPLPFTPVPVNLATLAVTLAGALLGCKYGTLSVLVYILLGAVGVPVFAGFTGGLGHLAGPTGGYIIGYLSSAFICGIIMDYFYPDVSSSKSHYSSASKPRLYPDDSSSKPHDSSSSKPLYFSASKPLVTVIAALLGTASCYILGTAWFMILTGNTLAASMAMCIIPFLPGDVFKIASAALIVPLIKKTLARFR